MGLRRVGNRTFIAGVIYEREIFAMGVEVFPWGKRSEGRKEGGRRGRKEGGRRMEGGGRGELSEGRKEG